MTAKSDAAIKGAQRLIPGGTQSIFRLSADDDLSPVYIAKAKGATVNDVDGHTYLDYVLARGALILGHADERAVVAMNKAASKGVSHGLPLEPHIRLVEQVVGRISGVDMAMLANSATEATMSAIRLARGFTKRDTLVRFAGCYHGLIDALLGGDCPRGPDDAPGDTGVPDGATHNTCVLPFNDLAAAQQLFAQCGEQIAMVLIEPIPTHMRLVTPAPGFLEGLRELCDKHQTVLAFDETVTGLRLGRGTAGNLLGVTPDLYCLGAIVGGGVCLGALGGSRELMSHATAMYSGHQPVTLTGSPLAIAAGIATLQAMTDEGFYETLEARGQQLATGIEVAAGRHNASLRVNRVGSIIGLSHGAEPPTCWTDSVVADSNRHLTLHRALLEEGVLVAPSPRECLYISAAHTEEDIEQTIQAFHVALGKL